MVCQGVNIQVSGVGCQVSGVRFSDDRRQMAKKEGEAPYLTSTRLLSTGSGPEHAEVDSSQAVS